MANALERTSERSRSIVAELHDRLQGLGRRRNDRIVRRVGDHWIAWRSVRHGRVFAELRPHRQRVEVFILPGPRELRDPNRLARRAPASQGWGWFRSRFDVTALDEVAPAFRLLEQSYEHGRRTPNGRSARGRRGAREQSV